jgi:hypothetical protein
MNSSSSGSWNLLYKGSVIAIDGYFFGKPVRPLGSTIVDKTTDVPKRSDNGIYPITLITVYIWELTNVAPFSPFEKERKSSVFFAFMLSGLLPPKPFNRVKLGSAEVSILVVVQYVDSRAMLGSHHHNLGAFCIIQADRGWMDSSNVLPDGTHEPKGIKQILQERGCDIV